MMKVLLKPYLTDMGAAPTLHRVCCLEKKGHKSPASPLLTP